MTRKFIFVSLISFSTVCLAFGQPHNGDVHWYFTCLWWSRSIQAFTPDHIPPKNEVIRLTRWEYSDPVAVPHPDSIDLTLWVYGGADSLLSKSIKVDIFFEVVSKGKRDLRKYNMPVSERRFGFKKIHDTLFCKIEDIQIGKGIAQFTSDDEDPKAFVAVISILGDGGKMVKKIRTKMPILVGD